MCRLSVSFTDVDEFLTFSFRIVVYLFPEFRKKEKDQVSELIDIRKIRRDLVDFRSSSIDYVKKKKRTREIELGLKLTTERWLVYIWWYVVYVVIVRGVCG